MGLEGEHGVGCSGSGYRQMVGTCENGNAPLCSIRYGEFSQLDEELLVFQGLCSMALP